jgi:branched-chain amino acid transport system permease protein
MTVDNAPSASTVPATDNSRSTQQAVGTLIALLALLWLFWSSGFAWIIVVGVLIKAAVYAVSAMSLNLEFGFAGLLNFGQVGFMLVGGYTYALLVPHELGRAGSTGGTWPVWAAVLAAMVAGVLLGLVLGIPTVRLRGDYLAIVTIAIAEILRFAVRSFSGLGQSFGIIQYTESFDDLAPGFVDSWAETLDVPPKDLWLFIVAWAAVLVILAAMALMLKSPWGRVLRGIRDDEDAVRALGKNAFWYKLQVLMIGGAIAGLSGVLFALDLSQISPVNFLPLVTFFAWTALILGGAGSLVGPIAGSVIFWVVLTQTSSLAEDLFPGMSATSVAATRFILMGALIMVLMIFRPEGLFGKREELSLEIQ